MKNSFYVPLILFLLTQTGCVGVPIVPDNAMPLTNRSEIFNQYTSITPWLDCLSGMLAHETKQIRITVDSIPNTFGNQKGLSLPTEFRPFVEQSLARITNVYELYDTSRLSGISGYSGIVVNRNVIGQLAQTVLLSDMVNADYILSGSMFLAQETKSAGIGGEVMAFGLNGEVKSYDVAVHLTTKDAKTGKIVLQKNLKVRIYSAEQGMSVFSLHSGELTQADASFFKAPSMIHGLKTLSDYLVAATVRDLSTALFQRSFSVCDREIPGLDKSRIPVQSSIQTAYYKPWFTLIRPNNQQICLQIKNLENNPITDPKDILEIRFQQYASTTTLNIPLGKSLRDHVKAEILLQPRSKFCLPENYIDPRTKNIECQIVDGKHHIIGTAVRSL